MKEFIMESGVLSSFTTMTEKDKIKLVKLKVFNERKTFWELLKKKLNLISM